MCSNDNDRLADEITALASHIHAATCRWLGLVAEFDRRGGWAEWGCRSCAHWISWRCGMGAAAAREHVRVAARLRELPLIRGAFERGRLSYSQVRALTRVERVEREEELLSLARHATAAQLERLVRAYRGVVARARVQAGGGPERYVSWDYAEDGALLLRARLPAEEGAVVLAALEAGTRALERGASAETPAIALAQRGAAELAAEPASAETPSTTRRGGERRASLAASAETLAAESASPETPSPAERGGASPASLPASAETAAPEPSSAETLAAESASAETPAAEPASAEPPTDHASTETPSDAACAEAPAVEGPCAEAPAPVAASAEAPSLGERRADALVLMADTLLANEPAARGGERYQVVVHMDALDLRDGAREAELADGAPIAAQAARRIACDAALVPLLERNGRPLSVGRKTRSVPPALRRALSSRDRGCRFPGCGNHRTVDAHHIEHWADGGKTSLENLVSLCRHHHRLLHEGGYTVTKAGAQFVFRRPDGRRLMPVPRRPRGSTRGLREANHAAGPPIDPEATVTLWAGERLDVANNVDALLAFAPAEAPGI